MFEAKNYDHLLGLEGFSDEALQLHFKLYQGYVTNTNKVSEKLKKLREQGQQATPEYAELKRRFGWEFNGMRLHELYFDSLTKDNKEPNPDSDLIKKIGEQFGSLDKWKEDFKATASMRGIGWTILYYDQIQDRLFNCWINEHDVAHLAGTTPLLIVDVFEHAFIPDYKLNKAEYLDNLMKAIDWKVAEERFEKVKP